MTFSFCFDLVAIRMKHVSLPAVLFSFLSFRFSLTQSSYVPCPILGPRYPLPSRVPESPLVEAALKYLTAALEKLTEEGGSSGYTATTPNTTSYSLALFDIDDVSNTTPPFFYEHHYASPSLKAQRASAVEVDSGSVYGIGGLSQALTVYSFLVSAGDDLWDDPITNYLPQLKTSGPFPQIEQVDWNNVRLIDLATQLAGIPRDGANSCKLITKSNWTNKLFSRIRNNRRFYSCRDCIAAPSYIR